MRWLDGVTDSIDMHLEKTLGDSEGQGSLVCYSPRGHKESDMTQQLNCMQSESDFPVLEKDNTDM